MRQEDIQDLQAKVAATSAFVRPLKAAMAQAVVGQEALVGRLLLAMVANGHVLLEGVPGLAKTLAVKTLAQALDGSFARLQFTPDLLPADIVGTTIYNQHEHSFSVKRGPVFANLVLADEINRAPAKVQSALLECMQERQATISGETHKMPHPFLVLATQNPIEQEGTYPLPEAQVDRFMLKLKVSYPKREEEREIIARMARPEPVSDVRPAAKLADIVAARELVDRVYVDPKLVEYILDIVLATRPGQRGSLSERQAGAKLNSLDSFIQFGASPRASISLALAAKAAAFLDGRAYVVPQDVKDLAPDILRHRIMLSYEAEAENLSSDDIIRSILDELRTP